MMVERPAPAGTQQFLHLWAYYDELESWTWDVPAGQVMKVRVYTAGDSVTLLLNGREVATNTLTDADKRTTTFNVPYAPGELTAVARRNSRVIARKALNTTGTPAAIRLTPDTRALTTSRDDLAHVLVEIVDDRGRRVPDAVAQVAFEVAGVGELAAVGSGNPQNVDSFRRPRHNTWHGQALAILRPADTPGRLKLVATAPGLRPAQLTIPVESCPPHRHDRHGDRDWPGGPQRTPAMGGVSPWPLLIYGVGATLLRRRVRNNAEPPVDPKP
jgi:beta-galactosidase